jgi:hypothetical protein
MGFRILQATIAAGVVDAGSGSLIVRVDGTSAEASQAIVTVLRIAVERGDLRPLRRLLAGHRGELEEVCRQMSHTCVAANPLLIRREKLGDVGRGST